MLSYNALERLIAWQNQPSSPTSTAVYGYDGSGSRVAQITVSGGTTTTTTYVGGYEEVTTTGSTTTTTLYEQAGPVTAVRVNGTLSYLINDHLSSSSVALRSTGTHTASALYAPLNVGHRHQSS